MIQKKKNIVGLDLGTNSIGWAWIQQDVTDEGKSQNASETEYMLSNSSTIRMAGSRIIPMSADVMSDFEKGNAVSQTKERTAFRSIRRMNERFKQRRERLNRVLRILGFLPEHYVKDIDRYGKLNEDSHSTIAWAPSNDGQHTFLFMQAFQEMVSYFKEHNSQCSRIPLDWTLYYLRTKALHEAISGTELAWVLHSFNQKRGYKQSRDEVKEEDKSKKEEYICSRVVSVVPADGGKGKKASYTVTFENGLHFQTDDANAVLWKGKEKGFVKKTSLDKSGNEVYSIRMPQEDDWELKKKRTESQIEHSGQTIGEFIFHTLVREPNTKIKGGYVNTIDRSFYYEELKAILNKQVLFHPELKDETLIAECAEALYVNNKGRRQALHTRAISDIILDDIIFYQRPLKSKKSDIAECPFEKRPYKDTEGVLHHAGIKCVPVSHPLFQEFRIWQFISNLRIYQREKTDGGRFQTNVDVSEEYLTKEQKVQLFDFLSEKASVQQKDLLKVLGLKSDEYRWNYVEEKSYPCGETRHTIVCRLTKAKISKQIIADTMNNGLSCFEFGLWHILYSVTDFDELKSALSHFADKWEWTSAQKEAFVVVFRNCPPFKKNYGAFSVKAIKKLLSLMRMGKYWTAEQIDASTLQRIGHIINGEEDERISEHVRKATAERNMLQSVEQYQGLPVWLACYVVYNRHAEVSDIVRWEHPSDLQSFINNFKQYSLRNPIVEQVSLETLRVVHDLWQTIEEDGGEIDEIHLEMGRDLKNSADKRKKISNRNAENEKTNFRIKRLLEEFFNCQTDIEGIRPYSPSQQELLRIYEETVWEQEGSKQPQDIKNIHKDLSSDKDYKKVTAKQIERYRLWLDQKYLSPYTKKAIPLARLFTSDYEIEHVIPRSKYFDDSFQNKVICEAEVNKRKSNCLGMEFIKRCGGEVVALGGGKTVKILDEEAYTELVNDVFRSNPRKRAIMLSEEITEDFSHRQLTDTRYIATYMRGILSNVVRAKKADGTLEQEATSKNLIVCTGQVTDRVKQDWGLNDVWNHIVTPRFERLNTLTAGKYGTNAYGQWENKDGKRYFQTRVPIEAEKEFKKKRIDHRHHAMDAIAIACVTRNLVNYLSNASANQAERYDLRQKLCRPTSNGQTSRYLRMPWKGFAHEAETILRGIVVSFKQNLRVITKATNVYESIDPQTGKRIHRHQESANHYAIRKPLHKDTVYGEVVLSSIKIVTLSKALLQADRIVDKQLRKCVLKLQKQRFTDKQIKDYLTKTCALQPEWKGFDFKKVAIRVYSNDDGEDSKMATRKSLTDVLKVDAAGSEESVREKLQKKIEQITDSGIRKILINHIKTYEGGLQQAFTPEGIAYMNEHIVQLNDGKPHLPIYKARISEVANGAFPIGKRGNRAQKLVATAKNTNLFFAVYGDKEGNRSFDTISLRTAIELSKLKKAVAPEFDANGNKLLFILSPNDLVYVLLPGETVESIDQYNLDLRRVYKMVSAVKAKQIQCFFIPYKVAIPIHKGVEYNAANKIELIKKEDVSELGNSSVNIKQSCIPLKVDRLGNYYLSKI